MISTQQLEKSVHDGAELPASPSEQTGQCAGRPTSVEGKIAIKIGGIKFKAQAVVADYLTAAFSRKKNAL